MRPTVAIERLTLPTDITPDPVSPIAKPVWEYQCVAHDMMAAETRDTTLAPWLSAGWEVVQVVTKGTHEFHYIRRPTSEARVIAD